MSKGGTSATDKVVVFVTDVKIDAGTDKLIKPGEEIVLTAKGGGNYSWSNGMTGASIGRRCCRHRRWC